MEQVKFCIACGAQIPADAVICPVCGASQNPQPEQQYVAPPVVGQPIINQPNQVPPTADPNQKEKTTALILCIIPYFIQIHGIHRFYTGHIGIGIIQLLTWGGCGIWTLIDLIQIISGNYKDSDGRPLKGDKIL